MNYSLIGRNDENPKAKPKGIKARFPIATPKAAQRKQMIERTSKISLITTRVYHTIILKSNYQPRITKNRKR
jgi:hypothetical protein